MGTSILEEHTPPFEDEGIVFLENVDTCLQSSKWCYNSGDQSMNVPKGFTNQFGNHWYVTMLKSWILQVKNVQYDPDLRFFLLRDPPFFVHFLCLTFPVLVFCPHFVNENSAPTGNLCLDLVLYIFI